MSDNGFTQVIDDAIEKVGEIGRNAGEAIRDFKESDNMGKLAGSVKKGAKTAASGVAKGAKIAAGGVMDGGKIVSETIKSNAKERAERRAYRSNMHQGELTPDTVFTLKNGVCIPTVGFGTYLATENGGRQVILDALEAGYRYLDTARFYQNEKEIGEAIEESGIPRDDIFIASKVWPTMLGEEKIRESFEASCKDLGTDHLDMFLIHWPKVSQSDEEWKEKLAASWKVMEELYKEGRIRAIGLSNFLPHHIRPLLESASIRPMLDQLELHVGYMQEYTLEYLKSEKILPQAWSPLGRAVMLDDERVIKIANAHEVSAAKVLLRYLVQRGIPVIPKASTMARMKANMEIFDFSLTEDEISYLSCIPEKGWSTEHPDLVEW